jgi:hypothetical protein
VRELLDGRAMVVYQDAVLTTQPAPGGAFSLVPRAHPSAARASAHRQRPPHVARVDVTSPALNERVAATRNDDQAGGRYCTIPQNQAVSHDSGRSRRRAASTGVPTHPWRQPFSRRERERQRARDEG